MAGLMLAAAFSVAMASTKPMSVTQYSYQSVVVKTYKKELNLQTIIRITHLDPQTTRTILNDCNKKGIDPFLVLGLLRTESRFNPKATSRKGARGLGQIMTTTGRWTARREGLKFSSRSLYNPVFNAKITISYFSYLQKSFGGKVHRALTAYNRGIGGLHYYERRKHTSISSYSSKVISNAKYLQARYTKLN